MNRSERRRLKNEIDRGMLDAGIRKVEEGAYEKESRLPWVAGGTAGFSLGASAAYIYGQSRGIFDMSPLGLFSDDYVLVMLGIIFGGTVIGGLLPWLGARYLPPRDNPPKDAP